MSRSTTELLEGALAHLSLIESCATNDLTEQLVTDAICLRLAAGVEVLNRLDPSVRTEIFGDDWPLMWGADPSDPLRRRSVTIWSGS